MSLRLATMICLTGLLAGCMSHTSGMNPLSTPQGREQARDAISSWASATCRRAPASAPRNR